VLDASSGFPDGLLSDGGPRLGHFDECVSASGVSPFATKYCMVKYTAPLVAPATPLRLLLRGGAASEEAAITYSAPAAMAVDLAVCVPAACNATEAVAVAELNLQTHLSWLGGSLQSANNCYQDIPWDAAAVAFFVVAALLAAAALAASFQNKFGS
jgi:Nose resistant-to-fluoxetine protein, N-terminal domain